MYELYWKIILILSLTNGFNAKAFISDDELLTCYECGSSENPDCSINPGKKLPIKECAEDQDVCITAIIGTETFRSCGKSSDKFYLATKCSESLCNTKIFPENRPSCYKCAGKDCVDSPVGKPETCVQYHENDTCYTNVIDELEAFRGCNTDLEFYDHFVQLCKGDGCNNEAGIAKFTCIECDSSDNKDCIRNQEVQDNKINVNETCTVDVLLGRESGTCYTYHRFEKVIRGCTLSAGLLAIDTEYFKTCEGTKCNDEAIPLQQCVVCGDKDDPECSINKVIECSQTDTMCHSCLRHDGYYKRGCGLNAEEDGECSKCQNKASCNMERLMSCMTCSSEFHINCTGWYGPILGRICETSDSPCVEMVNAKKYYERGCKTHAFNCDDNDNFCEECVGNNCNRDRLARDDMILCHTCNGTEECSTDQTNVKARECERWQKDDSCFELLRDDGRVARGCKSDRDFKVCAEKGEDCKICNGNSCNNVIAPLKRPTLSCLKCNSTIDRTCRWTQNSTYSEPCKRYPAKDSAEYCYSRWDTESDFVQRGCSNDDDICKEEDNSCHRCNSTRCNIELIIPQFCYQGISVNGNNTKLNKTACDAKVQTYQDQGCYVKRKDETITWGCALKLNPKELQNCKDPDYTDCNFCAGNDCDGMKAPGSKKEENKDGGANVCNLSIIVGLILLQFGLNNSYIS